MAKVITFHTFQTCKTWDTFHASYLRWMQKHDHPDLAKSNFNADKLREELANKNRKSKPQAPP